MNTDHNGHVLTAPELVALRNIQGKIGDGNAANGFHDRTKMLRASQIEHLINNKPAQGDDPKSITTQEEHFSSTAGALADHIVATLALFDTETSEAIEEVRKGEPVNGTYYVIDGKKYGALAQGIPPKVDGGPHKPEGVPSEVADVIIRAFDFAARFGIDIAAAIDEKLAYNATRGKMHGGKKL